MECCTQTERRTGRERRAIEEKTSDSIKEKRGNIRREEDKEENSHYKALFNNYRKALSSL